LDLKSKRGPGNRAFLLSGAGERLRVLERHR
jgi:hypothetical protein